MTLTYSEVRATCSKHGKDVEVVFFAGKQYCAKCLQRLLKSAEIGLYTYEYNTVTVVCPVCASLRVDNDQACTVCGAP